MTAVHDVASQAPAMRASTAFLAAEERRAVWVVIPCYNEDATLDKVLAEVARFGYSIVVVDDGSKIPATSLVTTPAVQVLRHCVNLGQGAALQTGIDFALLHGAHTRFEALRPGCVLVAGEVLASASDQGLQ